MLAYHHVLGLFLDGLSLLLFLNLLDESLYFLQVLVIVALPAAAFKLAAFHTRTHIALLSGPCTAIASNATLLTAGISFAFVILTGRHNDLHVAEGLDIHFGFLEVGVLVPQLLQFVPQLGELHLLQHHLLGQAAVLDHDVLQALLQEVLLAWLICPLC